mmetsp:Transcript_64306/g.178000  ORF Transcript_64306/g.178000 Transcript_64306/m.178000 type:complete len:266 (+) Transcript_64306:414-1211(+)
MRLDCGLCFLLLLDPLLGCGAEREHVLAFPLRHLRHRLLPLLHERTDVAQALFGVGDGFGPGLRLGHPLENRLGQPLHILLLLQILLCLAVEALVIQPLCRLADKCQDLLTLCLGRDRVHRLLLIVDAVFNGVAIRLDRILRFFLLLAHLVQPLEICELSERVFDLGRPVGLRDLESVVLGDVEFDTIDLLLLLLLLVLLLRLLILLLILGIGRVSVRCVRCSCRLVLLGGGLVSGGGLVGGGLVHGVGSHLHGRLGLADGEEAA